jgi:leucyl/phenylalanyl-tRNA---protein transferase
MKQIHWLSADDPDVFPPLELALDDPPGLLAGGGDLSVTRLVAAYRRGIFPWYSDGEPVLWWSPDPREVLFPAEIHVSRSLSKVLRGGRFRVTENENFFGVISACMGSRRGARGTWITDAMRSAYVELFEHGIAHSVEVWEGGELVGGLYGVRSDRVFCGESMFSKRDNASKVALVWLAEHCAGRGITLIDCQMPSAHLRSLGSRALSRARFVEYLAN